MLKGVPKALLEKVLYISECLMRCSRFHNMLIFYLSFSSGYFISTSF
jgi:hypothetical protein